MINSGLFNGIYKLSDIFSRFVLLNFLWFFLNIPVFFSLFNILIANQTDRLFFMLTTTVLIPFFFFPSTISLFAVVRKWIIDENNSEVVRSFFRNFKSHYRKGLIIGMFFSFLCSLLILDFYYFRGMGLWMELVLLILSVFAFVYILHFFCVVVHYNIGWKDMMNKTLLFTIGSPILFSLNVVIHASLLLAIYSFPLFSLAGYGSVGAYLSFSLFYKHYVKAVRSKGNIPQ